MYSVGSAVVVSTFHSWPSSIGRLSSFCDIFANVVVLPLLCMYCYGGYILFICKLAMFYDIFNVCLSIEVELISVFSRLICCIINL